MGTRKFALRRASLYGTRAFSIVEISSTQLSSRQPKPMRSFRGTPLASTIQGTVEPRLVTVFSVRTTSLLADLREERRSSK